MNKSKEEWIRFVKDAVNEKKMDDGRERTEEGKRNRKGR